MDPLKHGEGTMSYIKTIVRMLGYKMCDVFFNPDGSHTPGSFNFFSIKIYIVSFVLAISATTIALAYKCQDYGSLRGSPEGVRLTEDEHKEGWRRTECIWCHPIRAIHCDDEGSILTGWDMEWVRGIVERDGEKSCMTICHGDNGTLNSNQ